MRRQLPKQYPDLSAFGPREWSPQEGEEPIYSVTRTHANRGKYRLHNFTSEQDHTQPLIEYTISGRRYPLYTLADLIHSPHRFTSETRHNVIADLAERVAWRNTKKLLNRITISSRKEGLFKRGFSRRDGYVVASTDNLELCVSHYPNMVISEKREEPLDPRLRAELDGLFNYHKNMLVVLEVKTGAIDIDVDHLKKDVIGPLREMYNGVTLAYLLFGTENNLFDQRRPKFRVLRKRPLYVYHQLEDIGVPALFLTFDETKEDFERMYRHLAVQDSLRRGENVIFESRVVIAEGRVNVYATGDDPFLVVPDRRVIIP